MLFALGSSWTRLAVPANTFGQSGDLMKSVQFGGLTEASIGT
jgi:hypothetical protein